MRINPWLLLIILVITTSACTNKAWYEGVKEGARNNCRGQPASEVDACLERLNTKTYEEYEKERSGQK
ncbi:hypothetical protein [Methylophilus sp. 14]|uniref:hypothetical protein n=1 Tax=Methylophilus sp. 14 TaxID=2781019 RepID=UPI00188F65AB|nr:hypothetical protein [Methylophilus sp. 14]MBF4987820.1 hypothetical protein [Methylophilus sp. 14]